MKKIWRSTWKLGKKTRGQSENENKLEVKVKMKKSEGQREN